MFLYHFSGAEVVNLTVLFSIYSLDLDFIFITYLLTLSKIFCSGTYDGKGVSLLDFGVPCHFGNTGLNKTNSFSVTLRKLFGFWNY